MNSGSWYGNDAVWRTKSRSRLYTSIGEDDRTGYRRRYSQTGGNRVCTANQPPMKDYRKMNVRKVLYFSYHRRHGRFLGRLYKEISREDRYGVDPHMTTSLLVKV